MKSVQITDLKCPKKAQHIQETLVLICVSSVYKRSPLCRIMKMVPVQVSLPTYFLCPCLWYILFNLKESPKRFQRIRVNLTSESDSDDTPVSKPAPVRMVVSRPTPNKNPVVLEKERQMRFLLEHFPKTDAMVNTITIKQIFTTWWFLFGVFRKYTIFSQSIFSIRIWQLRRYPKNSGYQLMKAVTNSGK